VAVDAEAGRLFAWASKGISSGTASLRSGRVASATSRTRSSVTPWATIARPASASGSVSRPRTRWTVVRGQHGVAELLEDVGVHGGDGPDQIVQADGEELPEPGRNPRVTG
jgi:hypothetical protein